MKKPAQRDGAPRCRIWSMRTKFRPQYTYRVRIDDSGPTFAARGPRWRSPPLRAGKPPPTPSGVAQSWPRPHFFDPSLPFPSLCTFLVTFLSTHFRHYLFAWLFRSISHFVCDFGPHFGICLASFLCSFSMSHSGIVFV